MDMKRAAQRTIALAKKIGDDMRASDPTLSMKHLEGMMDRWPEHSEAKAGRWLGWLQASVVAGSSGRIGLEDMKMINLTSQPREELSREAFMTATHRVLDSLGDDDGYRDPVFRVEPASGKGFRVIRAGIPHDAAWLVKEALVAEADASGKLRVMCDREGIVGGAMIEVLADFETTPRPRTSPEPA